MSNQFPPAGCIVGPNGWAPQAAHQNLRRFVLREMMPGGWAIEDDGAPINQRTKALAESDEGAVLRLAMLLGVDLDGPKCGLCVTISAPDIVLPATPIKPAPETPADAKKLAEARSIIAGLLSAFAAEDHGRRAALTAQAARFLAPV